MWAAAVPASPELWGLYLKEKKHEQLVKYMKDHYIDAHTHFVLTVSLIKQAPLVLPPEPAHPPQYHTFSIRLVTAGSLHCLRHTRQRFKRFTAKCVCVYVRVLLLLYIMA